MIAENLIYFAVPVFVLMVVGLVLTILEFRYGNPRAQQQAAEKRPEAVADFRDSTVGRPAR